MHLLAESFGDFGEIDISLSSASVSNMTLANLQKQEGIPWRSPSATVFTIVGSLNNPYGVSAATYSDALFLSQHNMPVNTVVLFEAIDAPIPSPAVTYSQSKTISFKSNIFWMVFDEPVNTSFYRITITVPSAQVLQIYRMLLGNTWIPNFNYSNNHSISYQVSSLGNQKLRNGGTRVLPAIPYRSVSLKFDNLSAPTIGYFEDIVYQYSKHTDMGLILVNEETHYAHTVNYLGRLTNWTEPSLSLKGYALSLDFEEV